MADHGTDNSVERSLKIRQIISSVAAVLVTVAQCIILDVFIFEFPQVIPCFYLLCVADFLVVLLLIAACAMSYVCFINNRKASFAKYVKCTKFLGYLPLASLSWLAYATVMIAKITIGYQEFANLLVHSESKFYYPSVFKFAIAVSAPILLLMFSCHYNPSMLKDDKKHDEGNEDKGHDNKDENGYWSWLLILVSLPE
ncbi:uncharacterized protein LOC141901040 isoform X2 [Tubulanus polymorphus]|uniref:uncharacterized protein LOC141901040 isoform X2 n=1 Tax=Tubulanus polymorphus TaxID=672921 RepID=UPI003DA2D4F1